MHLDMLSGNFDSTLGKYKPHTHLTVIEAIKPKQALDLAQLWEKYTEFRFSQVEETTLAKITFCEAVVNIPSRRVRKGLKTQDKRIFPCNKQLQSLLLSIKLENAEPNKPVFTSLKGKEVNVCTFNAMCWHGCTNKDKRYVGIVQKLADEGKIDHYRPQYQSRHTFVTLCLDAGVDAKDVARWVGNSPEIIYKHYAGNRRDLQVPEL